MEIPNHRAGTTARSGATHVIDPTQENAAAVNVEQLDSAGLAQPVAAPRRAKKTGEPVVQIFRQSGGQIAEALTSPEPVDATNPETPAE